MVPHPFSIVSSGLELFPYERLDWEQTIVPWTENLTEEVIINYSNKTSRLIWQMCLEHYVPFVDRRKEDP